MLEPLQLYLIPPKLIESMIFLLSIITLHRKNKAKSFNKETHPSQFFLVGLIGWFIYITLDAIIYIIAPFSMGPYTNYGTYSGYNLEYPSLLIANILRDIGMTGAVCFNWIIYITAFYIRYGQKTTNKWILQNKLTLSIIFLISTYLVYADRLSVQISPLNLVHVSATWQGIYGFSLGLIILQFTFSIFYLLKNLYISKRSIQEVSMNLNQKIQKLSIGVIIMACGHFFWLLLGIMTPIVTEIFSSTFQVVLLYWIGHFFWIIAGIFIFLSVKNPESTSSIY